MTRVTRFVGRLPPGERRGPHDVEIVWFVLGGGEHVGLRPIHAEDRSALLEGFAELSEESRYQRFLGPMNHLTDRQAAYLTDVNLVDHFAWVGGWRDERGDEHGLGVARYVRLPDEPTTAELSVVVADDFHGRGLGSLLVAALVPVAFDHGVRRLVGYFFATNEPMLRIFLRLGGHVVPDAPAVLLAEAKLAAATVGLDRRACGVLGAVARRARRRLVAA